MLSAGAQRHTQRPEPQDQSRSAADQAAENAESAARSGSAIEAPSQAGATYGAHDRPQKSEEWREIADLRAQESMARSTEKIVYLTKLQFGVGLVGVITVGISLYFLWGQTQAAIKSANSTADQIAMMRRGTVVYKKPEVRIAGDASSGHHDPRFAFSLRFMNAGPSTAIIDETRFYTKVVNLQDTDQATWRSEGDMEDGILVLANGAEIPTPYLMLSLRCAELIYERRLKQFAKVEISYSDIFDRPSKYRTIAGFEIRFRRPPMEIISNPDTLEGSAIVVIRPSLCYAT